MEKSDLILFFCAILPAFLLIPFRRVWSKSVFVFIGAGMFLCIFAGEINGLVLNMTDWMKYDITVNFTPVVEELLKAVPVLLLVFFFQMDRERVLVFALATGIGFAILENLLIFYSAMGSDDLFWALSRGIGAGMMHGVSTLMVGYAMSFIRTRRKLFVTGTCAALTVAMVYHSIYNLMVQSVYYSAGILLPLITYAPLVFLAEKKLKRELR